MKTYQGRNLAGITAAQIDRVYPYTNNNALLFAVETDEFSESGSRMERHVSWNGESNRFDCTCGKIDCDDILSVIAFVRENKLEDYFETLEIVTTEVLDRREYAKATLYRVQDSVNPLPYMVTRFSKGFYDCHCPIFVGFENAREATCIHEQAARHFEEQFHAEQADHSLIVAQANAKEAQDRLTH